MEFYIEKHSPIPITNQIQDQVKLAVMMGVLRHGDTLPSIRDIEKQTGINRNQIHKAYLALRRSGLLSLIRGKGTVVATATASPAQIHKNCRKLAEEMVTKSRRWGISPTSFARYLNQYAQENERKEPFLIFVDSHGETAMQMADKISQLWQVPVIPTEFSNLTASVRSGNGKKKVLVNQFLYEEVKSRLSKMRIEVIAVEERMSDQTVKMLETIKPGSSVAYVHVPQPSHRVRFIIAHLCKLVDPDKFRISPKPVRGMNGFRELLEKSEYDCYLVGPAVRADVPPDMRKNPRVLQIHPQIDPTSLEVARIQAGVII
ncbi:MAG: GntR family transcriptional regulator [Acidobacteria bacterium]|nr:GntR family transcriptional regulator [Acidobacteriota bacterium]